jgi:hypothetical protein
MFSKMFCRESIKKPIEESSEEPIIKKNREPKLWITTQKSPPPHKFAPSPRCIICMSVMHTTLKCPQKN